METCRCSVEVKEVVQRTRKWLDSTITSIDSEDAKLIEEVRKILNHAVVYKLLSSLFYMLPYMYMYVLFYCYFIF